MATLFREGGIMISETEIKQRYKSYCSGIINEPIDSDKKNSDFILRYDWLKDQIEANPLAHEYIMSKLSPVTLQKAITQNKMEVLVQHEEIVKTVDITFESKREYLQMPETGSQLQKRHYISEPQSIDLITSYGDHVEI